MPMPESKVKAILKREDWGTLDSYYGPSKYGGAKIWEIWTYQDGKYHTRFIVSTGQLESCFESFEPLLIHLDDVLFEYSAAHAIVDTHMTKVRGYVAAGVFIACVGALLFMVLTRNDVPGIILTAILGLISSGAAFFFGSWVPFRNQADAQ